jgi:hypothetical protein
VNLVADGVDDLTPEWLSMALAAGGTDCTVRSVASERIGTGQIGTSYRLTLGYDSGDAGGPSALVAKLAGGDAAARARVAAGYEKEVGFYVDIAPTVDVRTPRSWYSAISDDHTAFTLLLDDLHPAQPGVQASGCSPELAAVSLVNLAGLHAPRWNDPSLLEVPYLAPTGPELAELVEAALIAATDDFIDQYRVELDPLDATTLRETARVHRAWQAARPTPFTVTHGDYRLDNLMFHPDGDVVTALDWQTVTTGPPGRDVAYFLGTSLEVGVRRAHEDALIATYHAALRDRGVSDYNASTCFKDYRLGQLQGPMITVLGCMYATAERSDRSDGMFLAMARRSCAAIRDLGSLDLL